MAHQQAIAVALGQNLQTESLRLTSFFAPSVQVAGPTWWADLVGGQPETTTSKPARGEFQQAGPLSERTLTLSTQPGRVDWFLTPRFEEGVVPEGRWAGRFSDALEAFVPVMTQWLRTCPEVTRLAFGAIVYEPAVDKVAGYRRLADYLPSVRLDPEGSFDFFYQINRPRSSTAMENLKINRLSKWSVAAFVPVRLALNQGSLHSFVGEGEQACRIELDISTEAERAEELPGANLPSLFEELKNLAVELATKGDVA